MNTKVAMLVAVGCVASFAATNYDLLGRNGSKMNSPMVYRDEDYQKVKASKQQGINSPLENKTLKKSPTGLNGPAAVEGAFSTHGLAYSKNGTPYSFYFKRFNSNGIINFGYYEQLDGPNNTYLQAVNSVFIPTNVVQNYNPGNLDHGNPSTRVSGSGFNEQYFSNFQNSTSFPGMEYNLAKKGEVEWWLYGSGYGQCQECGDVGIYMDVDAYPVRLNPSKTPKYLMNNADGITPNRETEMLSSRTYSILQATTTTSNSNNTRVLVTNALPQNPASRNPQVYMGVHNRPNSPNLSSDAAKYYGAEARDLDNYIYANRTVEIVAAGNNWHSETDAPLNAQAHALNAITVGAVDAGDKKITDYTPYVTKYCNKGMGHCLGDENYYAVAGCRKPEIYNYTNFFMDNDRKRTYANWYVYEPFYRGTESAAAYTAGLVAGLLRANPFYRWHPEVVKAVLLNAGDNNIGLPYPHGHTPVTTKVPTYKSVVFNRFTKNTTNTAPFHESRYWIGDWDWLYTHDNDYLGEIRFSVKRPSGMYNFSAAISWLTSGNDIADYGVIPQDFDLYVYESNSSNVDAINVNNYKVYTYGGQNSYAKASFTSSAQYFTIRIVFTYDYIRSDNYKQVVLGFDLASLN